MWIVIDEKQQQASREAMERMFEQGRKEAEERRKAREAHEACRCPHCGRNDPLPPWLMY